MSERNRKQEESRSASKPRPAYHPIPSQLAAPGSTILPHPGTHLTPDVAAGLSASSFAYPMIQPSYQTHIVVPTLHRQNSRTNPLTADPIGPPMFMPSLNLGIPTGVFPSSSSSSNPSHTGGSVKPTSLVSASNSSSTSNSFAFQPTSLSATTTNLKTSILNPVKKGEGNGGSRTPQPPPSVQSVKQAAVLGRGSPPLSSSSSISLVKPTIASSTELPAAAGGHMTYATSLYPTSGMIGMAVGGGMLVAGSNSGIMTAEGLFTCQGQTMPHSNLMCTEGAQLSTASAGRPSGAAVSSSNSSSSSTVYTSESSCIERPMFPTVLPVNTNHRFHSSHPSSPITSSDSMLTAYHHHTVRPSPHIPRPEAVSKTIIIPAPNLTGKDIASLTSSAHSSEANTPTSERPSNDLCLSGGSDSLPPPPPHETAVTSAPQLPPSVNRIPLAPVPTTRTLSSPSSPSLPSGGLSLIDTSLQQGSSSPRPSILRKRPLDRQAEGMSGTISPSMFLTNPLRTATSSAVSSSEPSSAAATSGERGEGLENHLRDAEFISSPRKRPRKQHFDNIGDNYYNSLSSQNEAQGGGVTSPLSLESPHPSMFANERLPGPLPLKTKTSKTDLVSPVVSEPGASCGDDKLHNKEVGVLYLAQLRKSPYPINGCLRVNHRAAHSHFKRHADIKQREETRTSLHDIASSDSSWLRASGWKIELFERNLQEMREAEGEVLEAVQRLQSGLSSLLSSAHCSLPETQTQVIEEVIQGNVDRSTRVQSHVDECSEKMLMVLDHSPRIMDLLKRYGGSRTNYLASAKHHT